MTSIFSDMPSVQNYQVPVSKVPNASSGMKVKESIPAASSTNSDSVEISSKEPKKKKGLIKSIKTFIANIKKACATVSEYTKGFVKGAGAGVLFGSVIYTGGEVLKHFKPEAKVHNKALAAAAAVVSVAVGLWNASLNATERSSAIDHRWTGHNN